MKAISFKSNQAFVLKDECVLCANCIKVCSQDAKNVRSDIEVVKGYIKKKEKVYVSLAPSFIAAFEGISAKKMIKTLMLLGFTFVEETAKGASAVSEFYIQLARDQKMKNIITTACPSIVNLVRIHYPMLVDNLAPCVSPMTAHAKMLKELYGKRIKVVFIGPCISKKSEYTDPDIKNFVDAVLTFDELEMLIKSEGLDMDSINEIDEDTFDNVQNTKSRYYPAPGGILKTLDPRLRKNYKFITVDGIERCIKILESLKNENSQNYFIEMSSCEGSCLSGPGMRTFHIDYLKSRDSLQSYVKRSPQISAKSPMGDVKVDLTRCFKESPQKLIIPDEKTIRTILEEIGKFTHEQELNCGTCGYSTCREKAIAVYNGRAYAYMCLPFIRERAESISNIIIDKTPDAIFALNMDLCILEVNQAAIKIFGFSDLDIKGMNILDILYHQDFINVKEQRKSIFESKIFFEKYNITVEGSILYLEQQNMIVALLKDITYEEKNKKQIYKMKTDSVKIADEVINKQMRVVQEIASLLGETTAETKVALTKLKTLMLDENG